MLYELRVYDAVPGKLAALDARFAAHALPLFAKHGIRAVGYWTTSIGVANRLLYLLAWESLAERERRWDAFATDPEWIAAKAQSEQDGPLIAHAEISILKPTEFSPLP